MEVMTARARAAIASGGSPVRESIGAPKSSVTSTRGRAAMRR
jgi:hypothetical protein